MCVRIVCFPSLAEKPAREANLAELAKLTDDFSRGSFDSQLTWRCVCTRRSLC